MSNDADPGTYGPVQHWMTDFDHADPNYNPNQFEIWSELRDKCPIAHSNRYGGTWLPVRHADVTRIAYDIDSFSNCGPLVNTMPPENPPKTLGLTPLSTDPPYHAAVRRPILPYFSPKKIESMSGEVRDICRRLLDDMGEAEFVDGALQYAQHVSTIVTAKLMGFPLEDADKIRTWVKGGFEGVNHSPEELMASRMEQVAYLDQLIENHRTTPQDDVTTFLLENATLDGEPWTHERVRTNLHLIMVAGVDTTWSSIGSSIWHLATHPSDLARLVQDPDVWPAAVEELLRVYAPLTMARVVTRDLEYEGCPMKEGDWVLLPYPAANVDPDVWGESATEVVIDRAENRHYTFGLGPHRCLGSNLARLEMRVALEEFVGRFPRFELADPDAVTWSVGQIKGPKALPLRILERSTVVA
jgi:cytochrome P450